MKIHLGQDEMLDVVLPSGSVIHVESFASPHDDKENVQIEMVSASREMTKRDREDAELNRYVWTRTLKRKA